MEVYTVSAWVNSLSRKELEDFLDDHKPTQAPPLLQPWVSPNLRHFLLPDSPERNARQQELMEESDLQRQHHKDSTNYPTLKRLCEMQAEWEELCQMSKGLRRLQGRSLPKLEESDRSLRIRMLHRIRFTQVASGNDKGLAAVRPFHHLSLYGEQINVRSRTPAAQSFWAARSLAVGIRNVLLSRSRKRLADRVRASEAAKWLDPVVLVGREDLDGQGSALCRMAAHWAMRAYLPGQGAWQPGEALVQRLDMRVTSRDPRRNPRVVPFRVTRINNGIFVNDDGRWHPPMPSRKGKERSRGPSPLFQVQAQKEVREDDTYEGSSDWLPDWSRGYSNEYGLLYESTSESENTANDLGQFDEVRTVAIQYLKSMTRYLMSFRGNFGLRKN